MATILYCFNPASAFHSAAYTESLFSALSFAGMWHLHQPRGYWAGVLCFALGTAARSNGLLNAGFVAHLGLQQLLQAWPDKKVPFYLGKTLNKSDVLKPLKEVQRRT